MLKKTLETWHCDKRLAAQLCVMIHKRMDIDATRLYQNASPKLHESSPECDVEECGELRDLGRDRRRENEAK